MSGNSESTFAASAAERQLLVLGYAASGDPESTDDDRKTNETQTGRPTIDARWSVAHVRTGWPNVRFTSL